MELITNCLSWTKNRRAYKKFSSYNFRCMKRSRSAATHVNGWSSQCAICAAPARRSRRAEAPIRRDRLNVYDSLSLSVSYTNTYNVHYIIYCKTPMYAYLKACMIYVIYVHMYGCMTIMILNREILTRNVMLESKWILIGCMLILSSVVIRQINGDSFGSRILEFSNDLCRRII